VSRCGAAIQIQGPEAAPRKIERDRAADDSGTDDNRIVRNAFGHYAAKPFVSK